MRPLLRTVLAAILLLSSAAGRADHYEAVAEAPQHVQGGLVPAQDGAAAVSAVDVSIRLDARSVRVVERYVLSVPAAGVREWAVPLQDAWQGEEGEQEAWARETILAVPSQLTVTVAGERAPPCRVAAPRITDEAVPEALAWRKGEWGSDGWCVFRLSLPEGGAVPVVLEYSGPLEFVDVDEGGVTVFHDRKLAWDVLRRGGTAPVPARIEIDGGPFEGLVELAASVGDRLAAPAWRDGKVVLEGDARALKLRLSIRAAPVLKTALFSRWKVPTSVGANASSTLRAQGRNAYGAEKAIDGDPATAWCEGAPGTDAGQWIEVRVTPLPSAPERCESWGWAILPGYAKSAATWTENARLKRFRLERCRDAVVPPPAVAPPRAYDVALDPAAVGDRPERGIVLVTKGMWWESPERTWPDDPLPLLVALRQDSAGRAMVMGAAPQREAWEGVCVRLTILDVAPGKHADACISEIRPIVRCE